MRSKLVSKISTKQTGKVYFRSLLRTKELVLDLF